MKRVIIIIIMIIMININVYAVNFNSKVSRYNLDGNYWKADFVNIKGKKISIERIQDNIMYTCIIAILVHQCFLFAYNLNNR